MMPIAFFLRSPMFSNFRFSFGAVLVCLAASLSFSAQSSTSDAYLTWTAPQAMSIGKSTRERGKAGGNFDFRVISTNKAINYEVRATLMTPDVIRAAARVAQLRDHLSDDQTRRIVSDAEAAGDLIVMVEINPNEGSGVIPLDWRAFLQPKGLRVGEGGAIAGVKAPQLRKDPTLAGLYGRNYEYDVFWINFPLIDKDKKPLISPDVPEIQLVVGIYSSEARISWRMPPSLKERILNLQTK
jgi:hypothetical protein